MDKKIIIIFLSMIVFLTGCWDRRELNDISIVTGIAVDPGEKKKYKLTVEVANAAEFGKQSAQGDAPVITYSLEGDSVAELTNKMNIELTKQLVYSHTRVLFINEEIAKKGLLGFLDFLERSGQFRNDFRIIVTKGDQAADFTRIVYPIQKSPSLKLHQQTESMQREWGGDPSVKLTDFISSIISKGRSPVAIIVKLKGDVDKGKKTENNKSLDPEALVYIDGLAVFNNDKMVGSLTVTDTRNYFWTQRLQHTSIAVPCNEKKKEDETFLDLRIIRTKTNIKTTYKHNMPKLHVDIYGEANIQGNECTRDLTNLDVYKDYEKNLNKQIKKEITDSIKKVQEDFGSDIYGFGDRLNQTNPKKFKEVKDNWDEEFARADLDVHVNITLLHAGFRNKSFKTDLKGGDN